MKKRFLGLAPLTLLIAMTGCDNIFGLDNYDEPNALLTGRVVYNGQPLGVRSNGIQLELWQPGYELEQKIVVHVDQDGTFASSIFNGDYEINMLAGGPWTGGSQRVPVAVSGNTSIDIPVTPYYTVSGAQMSIVPGGTQGAVQATFSVDQIDTSRAVELVGLYVGTTAFVDPTNRVVQVTRPRAQIADLNAPITLSVNLPDNIKVANSPSERTSVYARIGVKTVGISELIYSSVVKLDL